VPLSLLYVEKGVVVVPRCQFFRLCPWCIVVRSCIAVHYEPKCRHFDRYSKCVKPKFVALCLRRGNFCLFINSSASNVVFSRFVGPFCVHPNSAGEFVFSPFVALRRPCVEESFFISDRGLFFLGCPFHSHAQRSCNSVSSLRVGGRGRRPLRQKPWGPRLFCLICVVLSGFDGLYDILADCT